MSAAIKPHSMTHIFSDRDPKKLEQRILAGYLSGRHITELVTHARASIVSYNKEKNEWSKPSGSINLNKKSSHTPFCVRRVLHENNMKNPILANQFNQVITSIVHIFLTATEPPKVEEPPIESKKEDPQEKLEQELTTTKEQMPLLSFEIEQMETKIKEFKVFIQFLKDIQNSHFMYFRTQEDVSSLNRMISHFEELCKTYKETIAQKTEQIQELSVHFAQLCDEKSVLAKSVSIPVAPSDPEALFVKKLGDYGPFYSQLDLEKKKVYKAICQPDPEGPLFLLAAKFFLSGLKERQGQMVQDPASPHRYSILGSPREGTCIFKKSIIGFDRFKVIIPDEMVIEYQPQEKKWTLRKGPTIQLGLSIAVKDISLSSVDGNIRVHYKLPSLFKSLQSEVDKGIIQKKEEVLDYFRDNRMIVWNN